MIPLIQAMHDEISALCRRYQVRRLEIFGSATNASYDPQSSDLDFLVEFHPIGRGKRAEAYFGLLQDLQTLFNRPVDLVMIRAIRNPYFLQAIENSREVLYAD